MKIGCIGYSNNGGLGNHIKTLRRCIGADSQLVIYNPDKGMKLDLMDISYTCADLNPTIEQLQMYLDQCKPDIILMIETPFNFEFFEYLFNKGVKIILKPNADSIALEKFVPYAKYISCILCHDTWTYNKYQNAFPGNVYRIPYPIDTDYFHPDKMTNKNYTFVHSEGFGGAGFRKGTDLVFIAFQQLLTRYCTPQMLINSQDAESEHSQILHGVSNVTIRNKDFPEAYEIYNWGKVYLAPSRREGTGLAIPEAMACGLPVITTDGSPMREWFRNGSSLLIKVKQEQFLPYGDIPMYTPDVYDLMKKMEYAFLHLSEMEEIGIENREIIVEHYSIDRLASRYQDLINGMVTRCE